MSIALVITVFAGFAPTYYLRPYFTAAPLIPLLHLHGLIFTSARAFRDPNHARRRPPHRLSPAFRNSGWGDCCSHGRGWNYYGCDPRKAWSKSRAWCAYTFLLSNSARRHVCVFNFGGCGFLLPPPT